MADSRIVASKNTLINALILACSQSLLRDIVGTDALRSVLDVEFRELLVGGTFRLQPVWDLFASQPGFEPDAAIPPMCRMKSWERQLGVDVVMPAALAELGPSEIVSHASRCDVPLAELQKILRADPELGQGRSTNPDMSIKARTTGKHEHAAGKRARDTSSRWLPLVAAIAVIGLALGGYSLWQGIGGSPAWQSVNLASFAGDLPIRDAERIGDQVRATITDEGWLARPARERERALEDALRKLEPQGITVLFLRDQAGEVRATVQLYDSGARTRVQFF